MQISRISSSLLSVGYSIRFSDVGDGDPHDSATVLPDSAAGLHQLGASLLEHVKSNVSLLSLD